MLNINTKLNQDKQPKIELASRLANLPGNNSKIKYLVPLHYSKSSNASISVFEYPGLGIAAAVEDNNQKTHILPINHKFILFK